MRRFGWSTVEILWAYGHPDRAVVVYDERRKKEMITYAKEVLKIDVSKQIKTAEDIVKERKKEYEALIIEGETKL